MTQIISGTAKTGVDLTAGDGPVYITATAYLGNGGGGDVALLAPGGGPAWNITNFGLILGGTYGAFLIGAGIVTNKVSGVISGGGDGINALADGGFVSNAGAISGANTYGVVLLSGGVTNLSTGTISGGSMGVAILDAPATVTNAGGLSGTGKYGVMLLSGGGVTNQSSGAISGGSDGILFFALGTVVNAGGISGAASYGVDLAGGGAVTNQNGGVISGAVDGVVSGDTSGFVTVINAGGISGTNGFGVRLLGGGGVTNQSTGTISGVASGIFLSAGTVANAGGISGPIDGVDLLNGGGVANLSTGTISGGAGGIFLGGTGGIVTNWGAVSGTVGYAVALLGGGVTNLSTGTIGGEGGGIYLGGTGGTVTNWGAVSGTVRYGVWFKNGGGVANQSTGTISGGKYGIEVFGSAGSITNAGAVSGTSKYGVWLSAGGSVTNQSTGIISGGGNALAIAGGTGTITNSGDISGGTVHGVRLADGGDVTNESTGTISGSAQAVLIFGGGGTVTNAGSISGGTGAVQLTAGFTNRVIVDPGAVFSGAVNGGNTIGGTSISTLELAAGAAPGLISGLGSQFINFAQIAVDPGGLWTLTGTNTLAAGTTLSNAGGLTILDGSLADAGGMINDDAIQVDAAAMTIGTLTGTGLVLIGAAGTLTVTGSVAAGATVAFAGNGLLSLAPAKFSGQIDGLGEGGRIELSGITDATSAGIVNGNTLAITRSGGPTIDLTLDPTQDYAGVVFPIDTAGGIQFVDASTQAGPTVIDQGETESVTGAAGSELAAIAGGVGGITVTGANSLLITTTGPFIVGDTGLGGLSIEAGGAADAQGGMVIADTSGASGSLVDVSGSGSSLDVTGSLVVGDAGSGSLSLSEGASVVAGALTVTAAATGDGDVTLAGTGTTLEVAGALTLGGAAAGELSILGGARMTVGGGVVGSSESAPGNLDVEGTGSQLTINTGTLVVGANGPAEFTLGIGAVLSGEVANGPFGVVNEYGNVDPPTDPNDGTQNVGFGNSLIYDFYVANSGTIKITSGTATFYTPLVTDETNAADGSTNGLWVIGAHDTLVMNATSVDQTQTFDFTSPSAASLVIGQVPQASTTEFDTFNGLTMPSLTGSIAPGSPNVLPGWNAPIENFQSGDVIVLQGLTYRSATASGDVVTVWSGAGGTGNSLGSLTFVTKSDAPSSTEAAAAASQISALACFAAGTRIAIDRDLVRVEDLRVGAKVLTHDGGCEPIVWLGSRTVNCARHPRPETVWPVRIERGTLGENTPSRALYLSPDHAVFVDSVLVPVKLLINGTSIKQVKRRSVTYHHVELPRHAVILAEGLPVESYLDIGDRAHFDGQPMIRLVPVFATRPADDVALAWEARGAAPLVVTGAKLSAAREAVAASAPGDLSRPARSAA